MGFTSKTQTPSKDWLNIVKTGRAKAKIKQWLLKFERDRNKILGQELLERYLKHLGSSWKAFVKDGAWANAVSVLHAANEDELLSNIALGKVTPAEIINTAPAFAALAKKEDKSPADDPSYAEKLSATVLHRSHKENAVIVEGMDGIMVRIARCCNPIPGDEIIGFVTRGRGISVHTKNCERVTATERGRQVKVSWNPDFNFKHPVSIRVITNDRPGILSNASRIITSMNINIRSSLGKSLPDHKGNIYFEIEVKDYSELIKVITAIESDPDVLSVERVSSF